VKIRTHVRVLAVALAMCCLHGAALAAPPGNWKDNGYGYSATDTPLKKVLSDFARSFGVELKMSGEFPENVNGRIQANTAVEFLDRLGTLQRFQWFVYNNVLYVSPNSDATVERIEVDVESADQIKPALIGLGLYDPKFGWGELGESGSISVSGPSEYIRLVKQLIQRKEQLRKDEYEAMVFKVKYASVDDRTFKVRDQTVTTPGIASMLKSMIASAGSSSGKRYKVANALNLPSERMSAGDPGNFLQSLLPGASTGVPSQLPQPGAPAGNVPTAGAAQQADASERAGSNGGPQVVGDVRTNSIIVYDVPRKRDYYQRLIASLDTPQKLIEIEAYIVDVNRERLSEFGADFSIGSTKNIGIGSVATLGAGALSNTTLLVQNLGKFLVRLQMLESKGDARMLAKPSVLTLENLTAVLDLSHTVYIKSTGERVADVKEVTAGTLLRVTPRTIDDEGVSRIGLTVDIEDGSINAIPNSDTPEVQKSTINTQTVLDNQESLVIGGYDVDATGNKISGIPGLSRVPVVGGLFSTTQTNTQSRQRLFIITPRIVRSNAERDRAETKQAGERIVTLTRGAVLNGLRMSDRIGSLLPPEALPEPPPAAPPAVLPRPGTPGLTMELSTVPAATPSPDEPALPAPKQKPAAEAGRVGPVMELEPRAKAAANGPAATPAAPVDAPAAAP
jgi:type III secretion protein C